MTNERRAVGAVGVLAMAGALAAAGTGCKEGPTAPRAPAEAPAALAATDVLPIGAERASALQTVLEDARGRALQAAVAEADARAELDGLFAALADRVRARDRPGAERALGEARAALDRSRAATGAGSGALPDIEALSISLDVVEAALTTDDTAAGANTPTTTSRTTPDQKEN